MRKAIVFWAAVGLVGGLGLVDPGRLPKTLWAAEGPVLDNKGNVIQRADRPKVQDLGQAEKLVEEVFGKDITKAKTASEKVKVAGEIIKSAREEQDLAVRYAALQAARRLAVEALDGKLGLEIVREIVNTYRPLEEMTKDDRLAEADRLWQQAARSQGREKLAKQLEAVEQWLYTEIKTGLAAKKWEERINEISGTASVIRLEARQAKPSSNALQYHDQLQAWWPWIAPTDYLIWEHISIPKGHYEVVMNYCADQNMAHQSILTLQLCGSSQKPFGASFSIRNTGTWGYFVTETVGKISVDKTGVYNLRCVVAKKAPFNPKSGIVCLRFIELRPVD